jgi:hypothetical protein
VIGFRFTYLDDIDRDALGSYLYHTTVNLASGERLFVRMFDLFGSPFVVAKRPLIDKLEALRGDVLVLYGYVSLSFAFFSSKFSDFFFETYCSNILFLSSVTHFFFCRIFCIFCIFFHIFISCQ